MSGPANRRGFLRDLVGLPLIGGGLALIGAPSAAAQTVTPGMLATYSAWLWYERRALMHASGLGSGQSGFVPCANPGSAFHFDGQVEPRTWGIDAQERAPVILAAAGCALTSLEAEKQCATTFRPMAGRATW